MNSLPRKLPQTIRHGAIEKSEAQSNSFKKLMVLPAQSFARTSPSLSPPSEFCIRSGLFHPTAAQFAVWQPLVFLPIEAISNKCQATLRFQQKAIGGTSSLKAAAKQENGHNYPTLFCVSRQRLAELVKQK